jgi:hypothetical protein
VSAGDGWIRVEPAAIRPGPGPVWVFDGNRARPAWPRFGADAFGFLFITGWFDRDPLFKDPRLILGVTHWQPAPAPPGDL